MRRVKPALCALLALCLVCLCACSQGPARALAAAQEKFSEAGSFSCHAAVRLKMSFAGEEFNIQNRCTIDYTSEPAAVKLEGYAAMDGLGAGSYEYTAYASASGGDCAAYIKLPGGWVRQDLSGAGALEQYDIRLAASRWMDGMTGVAYEGGLALNGEDARCYSGTVSAEAADGIMSSTGAYGPLSLLGIDEPRARELLGGLGEIPLKVWILDSGLPEGYELDLTGVMGKLMDAVAGEVGGEYAVMSIDSLTVSLELYNIDAVEPIVVPAEALGAAPLDGAEIF